MTDFWNIVIYKIITVYYVYFKERRFWWRPGRGSSKKNRLDEGAGYGEEEGRMGLEQGQISCPRNVAEASKQQG